MRLAQIRKAGWYLCGGLIVLSAPIYNYLTTPGANSDRPAVSASTDVERSELAARTFTTDSPGGLSGNSDFLPSPRRGITRGIAPGQAALPTPRVAGVNAAQLLVRKGPERILTSSEGEIVQELAPPPRAVGGRAAAAAEAATNSRLARDLSRLERGYETAMGDLFDQRAASYGSYFGNPFRDALPTDDQHGGSTDNGNNNGNNNGNGGNNNNGNGGNNNNGNGGNNQGGNGGGGATPTPHSYSFLIVGDFEDIQSGPVFRAYRDNNEFVTADGAQIPDPLLGTVSGDAPLVFDPGQRVYVEDVDGDGVNDLVLSGPGPQGSGVQIWLKRGSVYVKDAETYFLWRGVSSLALFDFDRDDKLEVAILFRGEPNLFVFDIDGHELKYLKEIVLPFQPSVVVDSLFEGPLDQKWLHVFDTSFRRVASLTSQNPSVFLLGVGSLTGLISTCKLDAEVGGPEELELTIFEAGGRLSLFEKKGQGWYTRGSFLTVDGYPLLLFGDYLDKGSRQLFWVR